MKKPLTSVLATLLTTAALMLVAQPVFAHDRVDWSVNVNAPVAFIPPPVDYRPPVRVYSEPRRVQLVPVQVVQYNRHFHGYREQAWGERQRREYYYRHHYRPRHEQHYGEWDR